MRTIYYYFPAPNFSPVTELACVSPVKADRGASHMRAARSSRGCVNRKWLHQHHTQISQDSTASCNN